VATAGPNLVDLEVSRKRIPAQPKVKALPVGMMPSAWKDRKGRLRGSSAAAATACDVVRYCTARRGAARQLFFMESASGIGAAWRHMQRGGHMSQPKAILIGATRSSRRWKKSSAFCS
jgi:hypothetical protein